MMEQIGNGYQRIRAIGAFECENRRNDFKCYHYFTEKNEKPCFTQILGTQGIVSDKVTLDIDGFRDEPVVQCDDQVAENTFLYDSK